MTELEKALRMTFEKLTKEELISLMCISIKENLHSHGRKPKGEAE